MKLRKMWFAATVLLLVLMCGCTQWNESLGHWPEIKSPGQRLEPPAPEPGLLIKGEPTEPEESEQPDTGKISEDPLTDKKIPSPVTEKPAVDYVPEDQIPRYAKAKKVKVIDLPARLKSKSAGKIVSLDFQDEYLSNVLKVLSAAMGVNVVAHKEIAEDEITVYLKNISPGKALEAICKQYGYWFEDNKEFIRLVSVCSFGKVVAQPGGNVKRLKFQGMSLPEALMMLSEKTGRNVVCKNNLSDTKVHLLLTDISFLGVVEMICKKYNLWYRYDKKNDYFILMKATDFGSDMVVDYSHKTRVFNLKYASAPQLAETIGLAMGNRVRYTAPSTLRSYEHLKTEDYEDDEASITSSDTQEDLTENISGTKFEENLTAEKIKGLLDKRYGLMMTSEELRQINHEIGFALIALFLRNNAIVASSTDPRLLDQIGDLIAELDTPTPQVLIETKILNLNLTDDFTSFFDMDITNSKGEGSFGWTSGAAQSTGYGSAVYNFLDSNWDISATLSLLKDDGRVNTISSPMLVAAQNSEARAFIGINAYPLVTNIDAETSYDDDGNITSFVLNPVVETVNIGTELKVTPQINENKSVTLRVFIEQSDISSTQPVIPYYDSKRGALQDYTVSVVEKEEMDTIITVPQGKTLALGGLVNEENSVTESKVPMIGDLPLVGFFFKDHETVKSRKETVFLLTPHIIMSPQQAGNVSADALKQMEHTYIKDNNPKLHEYNKKQMMMKTQ